MKKLRDIILNALNVCDKNGYDLYFIENDGKILLDYRNIDYIIAKWDEYNKITLTDDNKIMFIIDSDCIYNFIEYLNRHKYLKRYKNMQKVLF